MSNITKKEAKIVLKAVRRHYVNIIKEVINVPEDSIITRELLLKNIESDRKRIEDLAVYHTLNRFIKLSVNTRKIFTMFDYRDIRSKDMLCLFLLSIDIVFKSILTMLDRRHEFKFILDIDRLRKFFSIPAKFKFKSEWLFTKLGSYSDQYYYDTDNMIDLTVENADQIWRTDIQTLFGVKFGDKLISEEMKKNQIWWWNSTVAAVLKYKKKPMSEENKKEVYKKIHGE